MIQQPLYRSVLKSGLVAQVNEQKRGGNGVVEGAMVFAAARGTMFAGKEV